MHDNRYLGFHYEREIPYKRGLSAIAQDSISEFGKSDSKGEFRINDLPSGKYTIDVSTGAESPWFAETEFEVVDLDIRGLELTVSRAESISGVVVLENSSDAAVVAKLSQLRIGEGPMPFPMPHSGVQVNKDRSFRLDGLKPGIHSISLAADGNSEGFEILRVERGEVQLEKDELWRRGIKVGPGENVTGVQVIVTRYTGAVRGQIKIEGAMPTGGYMEISATPLNQPKKDLSWTRSRRLAVLVNRWRRGTIDARGRFVINRLPPGEYEINLDVFITPWKDDGKNDQDDEPVTLTSVVTVPDAGEAHADFVLDLTKTSPRKRP